MIDKESKPGQIKLQSNVLEAPCKCWKMKEWLCQGGRPLLKEDHLKKISTILKKQGKPFYLTHTNLFFERTIRDLLVNKNITRNNLSHTDLIVVKHL